MSHCCRFVVLHCSASRPSSARSLRENSTSQFRSIQDFIPHALTQYKTYENAFFSKVTEELINAKEHPAAAAGIIRH